MAPSKEKSHKENIIGRSLGLQKKAKELATLCDSQICLINYLPGGKLPTTWPDDRSEVESVVRRYLDLSPSKKLPKYQMKLRDFKPRVPAAAAKVAPTAAKVGPSATSDGLSAVTVGPSAISVRRAEGASSSNKKDLVVVGAGVKAESRNNCREETTARPRYPLQLPFPNDRFALAALVEVLEARMKKAKELIARKKSAAPYITSRADDGA